MAIAERTGCRVLNALYGNHLENVSEDLEWKTALANLVAAAKAADRIGAQIVVEAIEFD